MNTTLKKLSLKLSPYEEILANKFISYITDNGDAIPFIEKLVLYGSRSLSEKYSNEESDMDIAVIVEDRQNIKNIEKLIESWIMSNDITGMLIHPIVLDKTSYKKMPFGKSIQKGDILWKKKIYSR